MKRVLLIRIRSIEIEVLQLKVMIFERPEGIFVFGSVSVEDEF